MWSTTDSTRRLPEDTSRQINYPRTFVDNTGERTRPLEVIIYRCMTRIRSYHLSTPCERCSSHVQHCLKTALTPRFHWFRPGQITQVDCEKATFHAVDAIT